MVGRSAGVSGNSRRERVADDRDLTRVSVSVLRQAAVCASLLPNVAPLGRVWGPGGVPARAGLGLVAQPVRARA
jgi:hypothetical protein